VFFVFIPSVHGPQATAYLRKRKTLADYEDRLNWIENKAGKKEKVSMD
jgi:hypothetical protein